MPSYYFIKLYDDILDDHKMGMLPDRLWRRTIEIFLLANRERNKDQLEEGYLPTVAEMAWTLRCTPEDIERDLTELHKLTNNEGRPIVKRVDGRWFVTKFASRQEPVSDAERKRRQRERDRLESHNGPEPNHEQSHAPVTSRDTDIDIESELDTDLEEDKRGADAPEPTPPKAAKAKSKEPPAVTKYREATNLNPVKTLYEDLDQLIGREPDNLDRWYRTCKAWVAMGWNRMNVKGMAEHYVQGRIPGDDQRARASPGQLSAADAVRQWVEEEGIEWRQTDA